MAGMVQRHDRSGAAVLTLDSPFNRNALSRQLVGELSAHLEAVAGDGALRAVALTGTGRTFCSGADLADPPVQRGPGSYADLLHRLWSYPKPVVVAVNGHVRAGGLGLVAAADVAVCVETASFAFTEVRIGVAPAVISVLCLRRMTPVAASRYMLTGETFGARAAAEAGLVGSVVDETGLPAELDAVLQQFTLGEPEALRATRELLRRIPEMDVAPGMAHAQEISESLFASEAAAEGIAAFREKRPPRWAV